MGIPKGQKRQGNYAPAKYRYFNRDTKHPFEWKSCLGCGEFKWIQTRHSFCGYKCSQTGKNNSNWKSENPAYITCHQRVYVKHGSANHCSRCGRNDPLGVYEWANLTGNYEDVDDYAQMCKQCHTDYDKARRPSQGRWVYTDELLERAEEMRQTMTLTQVADSLNVSLSNLCTRLKERERARKEAS